ncbi:hypothetical protein DL95DRAFT_380935, partial [Leptodontidium sp. 2 PMI_412]
MASEKQQPRNHLPPAHVTFERRYREPKQRFKDAALCRSPLLLFDFGIEGGPIVCRGLSHSLPQPLNFLPLRICQFVELANISRMVFSRSSPSCFGTTLAIHTPSSRGSSFVSFSSLSTSPTFGSSLPFSPFLSPKFSTAPGSQHRNSKEWQSNSFHGADPKHKPLLHSFSAILPGGMYSPDTSMCCED